MSDTNQDQIDTFIAMACALLSLSLSFFLVIIFIGHCAPCCCRLAWVAETKKEVVSVAEMAMAMEQLRPRLLRLPPSRP